MNLKKMLKIFLFGPQTIEQRVEIIHPKPRCDIFLEAHGNLPDWDTKEELYELIDRVSERVYQCRMSSKQFNFVELMIEWRQEDKYNRFTNYGYDLLVAVDKGFYDEYTTQNKLYG